MKKITLPFLAVALLVGASCQRPKDADPADDANEYRFVRLLVSDETSKQVSIINPRDGSAQTFDAQFPKSAVYTTASGRYGVLLHRDNNLVQAFDTGFEHHGDHVDIKGTPKWAAMTATGKLPTHYATRGNEVAIFNDGDGSLDVGRESDFHSAGAKMQSIQPGNAAHHGAMVQFTNGTYAITHKDGSIAGTLPERVKIVNRSGTVLHQSTVQTRGIHGQASDGQIGLFGSASGILAVQPDGTQRLIPHPASFGTAWFGTIYYAEVAKKFIGYTAAMGAYLIDPATGAITPILENKELMQAKPDYSGSRFVALGHDGTVRIYDLTTNQLLKEGKLLATPIARTETQKPTLVATKKFLYLTSPKTGEVEQFDATTLASVRKIKVTGTPYRLTVMGIESNEQH
jgi:hypothetical protein